MKKGGHKRIYLDYASKTPLDTSLLNVFKDYKKFDYNPSAVYEEGLIARKLLEDARKSVSDILGGRQTEIIFTSGGTESNNLAILGTAKTAIRQGVKKPHIIFSAIEHSSVLECRKPLEELGCRVSIIPVDSVGLIDFEILKKSITRETVLISIMLANNETGVLQDTAEIYKIINFSKRKYGQNFPLWLCDACQAPNYLDLNVSKIKADFLSLDGSKIYGPSLGVLFVRNKTSLLPLVFGGGQEFGLRSGTENLLYVLLFVEALKKCAKIRARESARILALKNFFVKEILKFEGSSINGSLPNSLPNIINFCIEGLDAEYAVLYFDAQGIAVSSASSCMSNKEDSYSYVVLALHKKDCHKSSLRISMGRTTKKSDLARCLKVLKKLLLLQSKSKLN